MIYIDMFMHIINILIYNIYTVQVYTIQMQIWIRTMKKTNSMSSGPSWVQTTDPSGSLEFRSDWDSFLTPFLSTHFCRISQHPNTSDSCQTVPTVPWGSRFSQESPPSQRGRYPDEIKGLTRTSNDPRSDTLLTGVTSLRVT